LFFGISERKNPKKEREKKKKKKKQKLNKREKKKTSTQRTRQQKRACAQELESASDGGCTRLRLPWPKLTATFYVAESSPLG
jgi:hypothetical protein